MDFIATETSKKSEAQLKYELDHELVAKSIAATPGIILAALWVAYTRIESVEFSGWILTFSSLIVMLLISRYPVIYLTRRNKIGFQDQAKYFKTNIILIAILWVPVILLPLTEFRLIHNTLTSIQLIALLLGLTISSVSTLACSLITSVIYQIILILPPLFYFLYLYLTEKNIVALNGFVILLIDLVFVKRQTSEGNKELKLRIGNSIELKLSNEMLTASQEQLIKESANLQQATKLATLGKISGEIAHEINNPLTIIQGNVDLILASSEKIQQDPEYVKNKLLKVSSAVLRITKTISGLKNYSRSSEHEAKSKVDLNHLINETLEFSAEKINFNKIKVIYFNKKQFYIEARAVEIIQVILNILSNGIDALTKLPIELRSITITIAAANGLSQIKISNAGEKINPDVATKLFDTYFSTKASSKGMGLGLSISKRIIESHNGRLYYDAGLPDTTFVIELPELITQD